LQSTDPLLQYHPVHSYSVAVHRSSVAVSSSPQLLCSFKCAEGLFKNSFLVLLPSSYCFVSSWVGLSSVIAVEWGQAEVYRGENRLFCATEVMAVLCE
jgi:hypothetical protein